MINLFLIGLIPILIVALFVWSLCVVAGRADRRMEEMSRKWKQELDDI